MRRFLLTVTMLFGAPALAAEEPPVLLPPGVLAELGESAAAGPGAELSRFGLLVDAGVPDGLGASLLLRPVKWVRLHAGAATNGFAPGLRGGLTLVPYVGSAVPSLTVEAAHFFPGNANAIASTFGLPSPTALLAGIGYRFASAHLGMELGSQESVSFFVRAGASYVVGTVPGLDEALDERSRSSVSATPLVLEALIPSLKLGLQFYAG